MMREEPSITMNSRTMVGEHSPADMEVLMEIEDIYFTFDGSVDPSRYVLQSAPIDCTAIEEMFVRLKRQQQVVSNKALHLITQKRDNCDKEFNQITIIQEQLEDTIKICREGRKELDVAKSKLTISTFEILANFRKRQIVQSLLKSLNMIRNLRQAEEQVQQLMNSKDYDLAIELVLEGQRAAANHKHFKCVSSLSQRLQDTLVLAEEQLDGVLACICYKFDEETFTKLQRAYYLLDKTQVAMDQLHMHFTSAINNSALEALKLHQKDHIDSNIQDEELKLKDLCGGIKEGSVVHCLIDLCERLWNVMLSYYRVVEWHSKQDNMAQEDKANIQSSASEFEANVNKEYVRQKLKNGLNRIWQDVQTKLSTYLSQSGLAQYPFEKFLQILGILKRMIDVAEEFCGDSSEGLQSFIKTHSLTYLRNYHASRMDVLRIFLENEGWEICPVKSSFNVLQLQEFEKLKRKIKNCVDGTMDKPKTRYKCTSTRTVSSDASSSVNSQDESVNAGKYFSTHHKHSPFHAFRAENIFSEDILDLELENESDAHTDVSDDEEPEELTCEFVDESPSALANKSAVKKHQTDYVIVTNTTLSVLRDCGQYLQMCRFLKLISFEVIMMMSQMFDYYLYTVHLFFASDLKVSSTTLYSSKLNLVLKRIGNNIGEMKEESEEKTKLLKPTFANVIDLEDPQNLHGLAERIVAVESLLFLSKQYEILRPYLESLVSPHHRIILQTFFEQTISTTADLRLPVYMCVASQTFNVRNVLISMTQVNWEVKNVMSQHSNYVDLIVRDLQVFSMRLDQISNKVPVSKDVHKSLWASVAKFVVHTLVEGFSNVSKCSDSGRGLMQLDYTQLLSKMEKISGLKPIPYQEYVDTYVKAYYMTKPSLEDFIKEHTEYSMKHLTALVNCACDSKKTRQELVAIIEGKEGLSPSKTNS